MNKKSSSKLATVLSIATLITSGSAMVSQTSAYYGYQTQTQYVYNYYDLFTEVQNNNLSNVQKFINSSNINAINYYGKTPLMYAGNKNIAETILSFAQKTGKLKEVLLAKDFDGKTALLQKIESENKDITQLIIEYAEKYSDLKTLLLGKDNNNKSVLMYFASKNNIEGITKVLHYQHCYFTGGISGKVDCYVETAGLDDADNSGYTALMYAVSNNHLEATKKLVEYYADVNKTGIKDGTTALKIAADKNNTDIFKCLIEKSAKIDLSVDNEKRAKDKISWETLKSEITAKNFDIISLILEKDTSREKFTKEFLEKIKNKDEKALEILKCYCDFALLPPPPARTESSYEKK